MLFIVQLSRFCSLNVFFIGLLYINYFLTFVMQLRTPNSVINLIGSLADELKLFRGEFF